MTHRKNLVGASLIVLLLIAIGMPMVGASGAHAQEPEPTATLDPYQPTVEVVATPYPTPTSPPRTSGDPLVHLVAVGESLVSLAAQSGFLVTDLAQRNQLTQPYLLVAGQKVNLPEPVSEHIRLHRVAAGETLSGLAAQYSISPYLLRQTNKLACVDCLVIGQLLRIPQSSVTTNLPEPFNTIDVWPPVPRQGDVVVIRVTSSAHLEAIAGTFAGRTLHFVLQEGSYTALTGIGGLQDPGVYAIALRAIADTGATSEVTGRIQVQAGGFGYENLTVNQRLVPLLDPQVNADEVDQLQAIESQWTPTQYWDGTFKLPVQSSRIASYYGARRSFNAGTLHTYHSGTDLAAPVGTPVYSVAAGRIAAAQDFKVRGTAIIIDHGRGIFTMYCHLSSMKVKVGDAVDAGQMIAYSGNTGRSEGPHLHWELAVGGVTVDALPWTQQPLP